MDTGFDAGKYAQGEWLKGEDLEDGERTIVTISKAYEHRFEQSGDIRPVIEFQELDQKLSLNKTRVKKLLELFGPDTTLWVGKKIAIYPVDVTFNGKSMASVAITRAPQKGAGKKTAEATADVEFMDDDGNDDSQPF